MSRYNLTAKLTHRKIDGRTHSGIGLYWSGEEPLLRGRVVDAYMNYGLAYWLCEERLKLLGEKD